MRRLRRGPLVAAIAIPVVFALFGTALIGESLGGWYETLDKPWFLVPLWVFYIVGFAYYVLFAAVLYRILVYVEDHGGRRTALALTLGVLLLNELWNYVFFGLESTLAGLLGLVVFLVPLTALVFTLRKHERFSVRLVAAYLLWVLYDVVWAYALWRLNGAA